MMVTAINSTHVIDVVYKKSENTPYEYLKKL
jgi:hypothetical protein